LLSEESIAYYQDQLSLARRIVENEDEEIKKEVYFKLIKEIFSEPKQLDKNNTPLAPLANLARSSNISLEKIKEIFFI